MDVSKDDRPDMPGHLVVTDDKREPGAQLPRVSFVIVLFRNATILHVICVAPRVLWIHPDDVITAML